ncbi:MAG: hypothetical protein AB7L13_18710 [Acidimicrobiia bacterium]
MARRSDHFLSHLGFTFEVRETDRVGTATLIPELCVPGTDRPHIGVLATLADIVAGFPNERPTVATSDLSVHVWRTPRTRTVEVTSSTLKAGRRLIVTESLFTEPGVDEPFGCSLATFMAAPDDFPAHAPPFPPENSPTIDGPLADRIGARIIAPGTVELPRSPFITNGEDGTIQGGLIALLAELGAESLLDGYAVRDLDVRYLNGVRVGPAVTTSTVIGRDERDITVRVRIDEPDRPIAHVIAVCRPVSS